MKSSDNVKQDGPAPRLCSRLYQKVPNGVKVQYLHTSKHAFIVLAFCSGAVMFGWKRCCHKAGMVQNVLF